MRAIEFIFESYPLAKKEFSQLAKSDEVQATIDQYRELVRKNQFRNPEEKNINYWRRLGWEAFSQMVKIKSGDVTDTQMKKGKVSGNAITLHDDAEWVVLIPLDKETSVHYGRGTEWCTTKPYWAYFEDYVYTRNITLIYAIDKTKSGKSVAISIEPDTGKGEQIEMFNQNDDPIDGNKYTEISGLDSAKFIQMAKLPENQQQLTASIEKYNVAKAKTAELLAAIPLDPEAIERELKITKDSQDCYTYIFRYSREQKSRVRVHPYIVVAVSNHHTSDSQNNAGQCIDFTNIPLGVIRSIFRTTPNFIVHNADALSPNQQSVFREYEESIKDDPKKSYEYAISTDKPFPAGEPAIATNAEYSFYYAYYVLDKPFPAGEAAIATGLRWATSYTQQFGVDLVKVYEETIKDDPEKAFEHASSRRKPFPAGEAAIATNAKYSYEYAYFALEGKRFPAGEPAIATSAKYSCLYAINVLKLKAFPLGEPAIITDDQYAQQYAQTVLTRYPSLSWEKLIKDNPARSYEYAAAHRLRFRGGEAAIATDPHYARLYDQMLGTNLSQR